MKNKELTFDAPELQVIEKSKAEQIKATFNPMVKMLSEFEENYDSIIADGEKEITTELTARAKRLRLDIGKVRIQTEKIRKEQKEEFLRAGKAIDGVSNILKWAVAEKENNLKDIEDHFIIQEAKRLEELQSIRVTLLLPFVNDAAERDLAHMEPDVWDAYLHAKKKEHDDKIKAEKKAEADRLAKEEADRKERERVRVENERLKKEAEENEKRQAKEKEQRDAAEKKRLAKVAADKKAIEEKARKEKAAHDAQLKAQKEETARIEREAKEKADRLQKEIDERAEADRKEKERIARQVQEELDKGDEEKVQDLINDLAKLKVTYFFESEKNQRMHEDVCGLIDKIINHIKNK